MFPGMAYIKRYCTVILPFISSILYRDVVFKCVNMVHPYLCWSVLLFFQKKEFCMNHPIMKYLGMVSWAVTALVSINVGMIPFGYDFFQTSFAINNLMQFSQVINYAILGSGVLSLAMLVMVLTGHGCGSCKCK